jgi:ABC-type nitrate/sulfonate/bicarbonate transport system ATPase subunit
MQQRVEIARAPAADGKPFGALDCITRFKMRAEFQRISQSERNTILCGSRGINS